MSTIARCYMDILAFVGASYGAFTSRFVPAIENSGNLNPLGRAEKRIEILNHDEITRLLRTASVYANGACLAAVAIMLLAGVRPHECARLRWGDVRLDKACHAKAAPVSIGAVGGAPYAEATGVIVIFPAAQ